MNHISSKIFLSSLFMFSYILVKPEASSEFVCISGQEIIARSMAGIEIHDKLAAEQEKLTAPLKGEEKKLQDKAKDLDRAQAELDTSVAEFKKTASTLKPETQSQKLEEFQEQEQKLIDGKRDLERMWQKFQADAKKIEAKMQALLQQERSKFDTLVSATIAEVAQEQGWKIVFMQEQLAYAHPSVEKTKLVIAKLDEKTKAAKLAKKEALEAKKDSKPKDTPKK